MSSPVPPPGSRRASYLVVLGLMIFVLLGFVAIAVDASTLYLADAELEVAVDAAALAGASHLDGTAEGVTAARSSAVAVGQANAVRRTAVVLDPAAFEFGIWDYASRTFVPSSDVTKIDTLRIRHTLSDVPTPFAGAAFSSWIAAVVADATAVRPPAEPITSTPCFIPIAISTCIAAQVEGQDPSLRAFRFGPDSTDDIAWGFPGGVNAHTVAQALDGIASGTCVSGSDALEVGSDLSLQNGIVASNLLKVRNLLDASNKPWNAALWGAKPPQDPQSVFAPARYPSLGVLMGPVPVIDDGGSCAMKYNQTGTIDHIVWGVLFDEYLGGNRKGFQLFLDVEHEWEDPGGGTGGGTGGNVKVRPPARLVE